MSVNKQTNIKSEERLNNEDGFVLVLAMLIMVVLIVIGVTSIKGSKTELLIAGNERLQKNRFFAADSAWPDSAVWLNGRTSAPPRVNLTGGDNGTNWESVRNFGDGGDGNTTIDDCATDGDINGIAYWYKIDEKWNQKAVKFGKDYREFVYDVEANADRSSIVEVRLFKVYKVGYN